MERRGDALAGHKHHVTKDFLEFLKQQTMSMCQQENLNQVDLLSPAKVRITDREYWAQRRGQRDPDAHNKAEGKPLSRFETQNMSSPDLAFAIKKENLKQEAKSVAYLLERGLTPKEMENRYAFASEDFHSQAAALKELEAKLKEKKSLRQALNDYYRTKALHREYLAAKGKKRFRETHPELMIYDAAVKELRAHYGKDRFPSKKQITEELQTLVSEKNAVYERYCVARNHYREMQAVRTNYYALQGQERPAEPEHDPSQNRT